MTTFRDKYAPLHMKPLEFGGQPHRPSADVLRFPVHRILRVVVPKESQSKDGAA